MISPVSSFKLPIFQFPDKKFQNHGFQIQESFFKIHAYAKDSAGVKGGVSPFLASDKAILSNGPRNFSRYPPN